MRKIKKKFILFINTVVPGVISVLLFDGKKNKKLKRKGHSDQVLEAVASILEKNQVRLDWLKGIVVVSGPGSFTAVRQGVVIANTLGFALRIPIFGVRVDEFKSDAEFIKIGITGLEKTKVGKMVLPFYGKEPNITRPKEL